MPRQAKDAPVKQLKSQHQHLAGQWYETSQGILYVAHETVQFDDDLAHWHHGFCRLLEIPEDSARALIEKASDKAMESYGQLLSDLTPKQKCHVLKQAALEHFGLPPVPPEPFAAYPESWGLSFDGRPADTVFARSISGNRERMVVGLKAAEFGWQVSVPDNRPVPAASVCYDLSYYDMPRQAHCGMRDYIRHEDWRLEKARRLMRTVLHAVPERSARWQSRPDTVLALDVGSALGYFRKAMAELGFQHYGVDISEDALAACREAFGYETWHGTVFDLPRLAPEFQGRFDMITLWDTIEHLDDPLAAMRLLKGYLSDTGALIVRTPNLVAFEADILGDMYYSFKLDHIRYFSPRSLTSLAQMAGLEQLYVETTSHLFKGIFGANYLYQMGKALKGADIVAIYGK